MNYTYDSWNVEENYNEVLINFFRRIETYDTSRPIRTWLHIVTKRMVAELERRRKRHDNKNYDRSIESYEDCGDDEILHPQICSAISANLNISSNCMGLENYRQFYNDDILEVLERSINISDVGVIELAKICKDIFDKYTPNYDIRINNLFLLDSDEIKEHFIVISYDNNFYSYNYNKRCFIKIPYDVITKNIKNNKIGIYEGENFYCKESRLVL